MELSTYITDSVLGKKTQVLPTETKNQFEDRSSFIKDFYNVNIHNRKTHSESVSKIALELFKKWEKYKTLNSLEKQKNKKMLYLTCMLHDVGQASYGHALADLANKIIGEFDENLFFDDNSNNLIFLEMYNLRRTLKTLGISYKQNIKEITKLLDIKDENKYYEYLYNLYQQNPEYEKLPKRKINKFKKNLQLENTGLLLDKELFCYLIKRPYALNRKFNIKKGLYPDLHVKYIPDFFKMKQKEIEKSQEINKKQLNITWFMDMSDEIAYIIGDYCNFINLYYNIEKFQESINKNYPDALKLINEINKEIITSCNFTFQKNINKSTDFNLLENKLIRYFLKNIKIKDKVYTNDIKKLFTNKKTINLFEKLRTVNYDIYIKFTEKNLENKFSEKGKMIYKAETFLSSVLNNLKKQETLPNYIINNIYSDLYKELLKYHLENKNIKKVALYYINYLMELNLPDFDRTINEFYNRNPKKLLSTDKKIKEKKKTSLQEDITR